MTKENLKFAFRFLDHDNTKTINVKNILHAFITKPNKEIETIFLITFILFLGLFSCLVF